MARPFSLRGYVVEQLLGSGSSGDVWQARVASSGARVALKRIPVSNDEQLRRAHTEAALLCALDHPNLVRLHAVVPAEDCVVLVLDLADGGSLAGLLAARRRLTPGEVITAVAPVGAALAYLHEQGVVHGDVSAANILFTASGVAMLADVGVARLTGDDMDAEATPAYVDPAVAAGCVPGPPSDVFMLGGVALHALCGAPPWPDADADQALARAARAELIDVAAQLAAAGVEPVMAAVVQRALAIDPHRRGTAADLALDLRHSGSPVAVELAAGAARAEPTPAVWMGPRHAAVPARAGAGAARAASAGRSSSAGSAGARGSTVTDDRSAPPNPARPAFARPTELRAEPGGSPPTRMVAPRPRPVIPRPSVNRRLSRRAVAGGSAALACCLLAVAAVLWLPNSSRHSGRSAGHPSEPQAQVQTLVADQGSAAPSTRSPRSAVASTGWSAQLAELDGSRTRAFATRDASLLRRVYVSGPLLNADTALLERVVAPGCALAGVHTRYASVRATASDRVAITLTATATLAASRLVCAGAKTQTAPGAGPIRLRLVLTHTADGVRIADLRRA